jgi:hypothetical protein
MSNIFNLEDISDFSEKINLDELYEKKRQDDLAQLALFQKVLNRIHVRIKTISYNRIHEPICWYVVPETIIGVPNYDHARCIAYLLDKLNDNGFKVRYFHPNTLLISWAHWVPSYVRTEIKKKTGITIDEFGRKVEEPSQENDEIIEQQQTSGQKQNQNPTQNKNNKNYKPIDSYKPVGIYNKELLNKIEDKFA